MIELISDLVAGFSVVSAGILYSAYALLMPGLSKSWHSLASGALLVLALSVLQIFHVDYFLDGREPLSSPIYRFFLFVVPSMFFFFSRSVILPTQPLRPYMSVHLLPIAVLYIVRLEIALPILFLFGTAYSIWLGNLIYTLREKRKQFRFELYFFATLSVVAVFVLVFGFSIPYIDDRYFYLFYTNSIGLAFVLIVAALIAIPDLVGDLSEAGRIKYSTSTLGDVDVDACLQRLDSLMKNDRVYQDESLTLSSLAGAMDLSNQQLSELINTRMEMGFSRYIRQMRVEAAKELLTAAPDQSILSISLDVGFRSQSNFYAAFKEITGISPGDYRRARS